jgi:hypothetical protein
MATYKSKRPYTYGTGRRKSSVARVHLIPGGTGAITVNGRSIDEYFGLETLKLIVRQPLVTTGTVDKFDVEPPSPAAAYPARPAPSATASPELCWQWTPLTVPL